ncbi:MAG: hypothetical protein R2856_26015 [Caldilineaceae bacterium]
MNNPLDSDGDGTPDAVESSIDDADSDGVADEFDADDADPNNATVTVWATLMKAPSWRPTRRMATPTATAKAILPKSAAIR